jgi:hypothetical protein
LRKENKSKKLTWAIPRASQNLPAIKFALAHLPLNWKRQSRKNAQRHCDNPR